MRDGRSIRHLKGTKLDEREVLLPRGTLWRVNPTSARGMKQGLRAI